MTYENNIRLERKFTKQIKAILGLQFIGQDSIMDREQGTDFLVFSIEPIKVGIRLRTYNYYLNPKFRQQFTIRYELYNKGRTEIHKIREGLVNYILYGFVNEQEDKIIQYFIGDLNVFRNCESADPNIRTEIHINKDENPTKFISYYIKDFPENFVIKKWTIN